VGSKASREHHLMETIADEARFVLVCCIYTQKNYLIVSFVETPRKFVTAKLSIRKPGSSSVLIICIISYNNIILLALMKIRAYGSKALQ
jgi:hypothetical protein